MQLVYHLSDAARKRIFIESGRDPGQVQRLEVDPATLSTEDRRLLVTRDPNLNTTIHLDHPDWDGYHETSAWLKLNAVATDAAELLAAYRDVRAAGLARVDAAIEERIAAKIQTYRAWDDEREPGLIGISEFERSPRRQELLDARAAAVAAAKAKQERLAEQRKQDAARQEAEKAARLAERRAWALEHGSSRLRKCIEMEYDCQRLYVLERAAIERPGYVVDFDDKAAWKSRSGPSEAALDEAARVGGEVVWLTRLPLDDGAPEDYQEGWEDEREAVVIRQYLGKYDLIKIV